MPPQQSCRIRRKNPKYFDDSVSEQPAHARPVARNVTGRRQKAAHVEKGACNRVAPSRGVLRSALNAGDSELPHLHERGSNGQDEECPSRACSMESIEGGIDSLLRLLSRVSKQIECAKRDTDKRLDLGFNQIDRKFDTVFRTLQLLSSRLDSALAEGAFSYPNVEKGTKEEEWDSEEAQPSLNKKVLSRVVPKPPPRAKSSSSYVNLRSEFNAMVEKYNTSVPVARALSPIPEEDIRGARVSSTVANTNFTINTALYVNSQANGLYFSLLS